MKLKRRHFIVGVAGGFATCFGFSAPGKRDWRTLPRDKATVETFNTAKNLIFILLQGGPSHVDTFDLKTFSGTPDFLGPQTLGSGALWPAGAMPMLAERWDKFSLLRSGTAEEAVHTRAIYHLLTAHRQNPSQAAEIPHFASMLSFKLDERRSESDSLPTLMMTGLNPAGNGFLAIDHLGLRLSDQGGIDNLDHAYDQEAARFDLAARLWEVSGGYDDRRSDHRVFQSRARTMMLDDHLKTLLNSGQEEVDPNDVRTLFMRQCQAAVNVIGANRGTRVFQLQLGDWDHHVNIYNNRGPLSLFGLTQAFDEGYSYLIDTLDALPAADGEPGTLLDQTLIVALGEFGRTTGNLNTSNGRDHFPNALPVIFAGGGIKPGRVVGATNGSGSVIVDPGWARTRYMGINDLMATIYSALGIDWTETFADTPSGRVFEMVDTTNSGPAFAIDNLFV